MAAQHYLQLTDEHFERAVEAASEGGQIGSGSVTAAFSSTPMTETPATTSGQFNLIRVTKRHIETVDRL